MAIFEPSYYKAFTCLGDKCKNTCCKSWNIVFNKKDYDKLKSKHFPLKLRNTLRQCVKRCGDNERGYGKFVFDEKGFCPLFENGLCSLQVQAGYEYLTEICKKYPRFRYMIGNTISMVCTNSCEQVLNLLLKEELTFERREATVAEIKNISGGVSLIEVNGLENYYDMIQTLSIVIMQNRAYSLENRLLLLGMATKSLQQIWEEKKLEEIPRWLGKWAQVTTGNSLESQLSQMEGQFLVGIQSSAKNVALLNTVSPKMKTAVAHAFDNMGIAVKVEKERDEEAGTPSVEKYSIDSEKLKASYNHLNDLLGSYPLFMENVIINHMLSEMFPLRYTENFFDSYITVCHNYALMRFMAIGYAGKDGTIDDVIDGIVHISRVISHNFTIIEIFLKELKSTNSDTLAHMAYLIRI